MAFMTTPLSSLRLHARRVALLFCVLLLLSSLTPAQVARRTPPKKRGTMLFVVTGEAEERHLDALVLIEGGKYKEPTGGDPQGRDLSPFKDAYLRAGQQYRLLFGGGEAGTVTVRKASEGCNNIHAEAEVVTATKLGGHVMALATDSETLGRRAVSRRALTETERAAIMELVQGIYRQKGTSAALLRALNTRNLTATDLDGDGAFEIVGSFRIEAQNAKPKSLQRDLFLIAAPQGKGYRAELAYYQSYQLVEGFGRGIDFVDQLDMDGDGKSEVVTIDEGFDAYGYSIYKKLRGVWRNIYSTTGDAC
jgi:hypothetical protein